MEQQVREKRIVAATSVGAAIFLTGAKLIIGLMTGSLGILAEAAHSALDLAAAIITFIAVRLSDRPADETHLYGHGKVENLSALAETLLLLITCVWIIKEGIHRLFFVSVEVDPSLWAFLVMGVSIVVDLSRSRALARIAKKYRSQALEADALHFSTDIWSSAVVIIGLAVVRFGESRGGDKTFYRNADAIAALVVAIIVIYISLKLGRRAIDALLDHAPAGLAKQLAQCVQEIAGIQRVSRIRVRDVGSRTFVDLEIEVPRHLSFEEINQLTGQARESVLRICPEADAIVQAVPIAEREGVLEKIQAVAARKHVPIHNICAHWTEQGIWIDLDLEVDPHISFDRAHEQATNLEEQLRVEMMQTGTPMAIADINVHIEPRSGELIVGAPLDPQKASLYIQRIEAIERNLKGSGGSHHIELHEINGNIYLSFHLLINKGFSIAEAHGIAEEMENRLRREFPQLGRVVIHTEPS
jgi:cation diffusion facilitator family transporter